MILIRFKSNRFTVYFLHCLINQFFQPVVKVAEQDLLSASNYPDKMVVKKRDRRIVASIFLSHIACRSVYKGIIVDSMKTLKFKLYQHKRNRYLKRQINTAGVIYNHAIALHKRYYRMFGKHLNCAKLQKHIARLRKRIPQRQQLGSQAVQDICKRIEKSYQLFFKYKENGVKPPSFKKVKKYKSFTLKQAGYKFLGGNRIKIGKRVYQFWNSQPIEGKVKTVTVKRTPLGELFLAVVIDTPSPQQVKFETDKSLDLILV